VRYFTLADLLDRPADDAEVVAARQAIMETGPVPAILAEQHADGYWVKPGPGYTPKYRSTVWSVIFLWLARAITGQGIAPAEDRQAQLRYYKSGTCGPGFACAANNRLPCAWGAVKAMLAFGKLPQGARTPTIEAAIETGVEFLLSRDPAVADYPAGWSDKPSRSWFKFGFPVFYVTDVLQNLGALTSLGLGPDPRLNSALQLVLSKQDEQGRWKMKYTYKGKTWADIEEKGQPSRWVTLRALRALKGVYV